MRPRINILDEATIIYILTQAKQILSEIGMAIEGAALRQEMLARGLAMDKNGRIRFPPDLVDQAIASTPQTFTLYDRAGQPFTTLGGDKVHFVPGSSGLQVLDLYTGQTRPAKTADFVDYVRLAAGLSHIAFLSTAFSTADLADEDIADAWRLYLCLSHTTKPILSGAFTEHGVPRMAEMLGLFRHDRADLRARPSAIFTITASGSFRYLEDSCQNLLDCVQWGIPIEITPVTLMGLAAPVTLVGATIFHTADVLAGLTMAQMLQPGTPLLFGGAPAAFHMKTATSPMGAIEAQQLNIAYTAVAKYLNIPCHTYMALSESKALDAQAGAETFASALLAVTAGIDCVAGPGMLDYLKVYSPAKLVFDDEVCGQALHFAREFTLGEDALPLDLARGLIAEGQLLTADHTLDNWRDRLYIPGPLFDRSNRDQWQAAGSPGLQQRAAAEVERRLAAYEPIHTAARIDQELRRLLQAGTAVSLPDVPRP